MNKSLLFKNAILNLYKAKIYTVDFAILKAEEMSEKNKINANDYEELLTYLAEEQIKEMEKQIASEEVENSGDEILEETEDEIEVTE